MNVSLPLAFEELAVLYRDARGYGIALQDGQSHDAAVAMLRGALAAYDRRYGPKPEDPPRITWRKVGEVVP